MLHSLQQLIASCGRCTTSSARQLVVLLLSATFGLGAQAQSSSFADCSLFAPGPNDTWTHALTATTPDDPNSSTEQTLQLNVVSLPEGGANYRVAKTVANGNWFNGNAQPLSLGENVITVSAVSFARSVKFQFSSGEVIFDALVLNSTALDDCFASDPGTPIAECNLFDAGPNATWTHVLTATTPDDPNSSAAQTLVLNVASLPEGGANYRVAKTVANGNWFNGNAQALALGENSITVSAVSFARSVKFQFSSGAVGLSAIALNGADLICGAGCTDASACNYDDSATTDDGSCTFPASESVDCDGNCLVAVDCAGECGGSAILDDCGVCGGDGSSCAQANVTFHVDMNLYGDLGASTVFVNGSFNGWCGACNPMADADGDGIWSVTLPLDPGTIEYKFTVDGWNNQENFAGGESCTSTIDGYTNRTLTFDADTELDVVCWGSCDACPDEVIYHDLTLEVNTANIEVGPNGMYAGGGVLGDAQAVALSDNDADDIWSATISVLEGTSGNYTFLNSPNDGGDWGAKEDLSGQACADVANYNDRILEPVLEPTTISTCFGECSTDGSCAPPPSVFYDVTFNVNMANEDVSSDGVFLAGGVHFGWPGDNPMSDDDGDGIWTITVNLAEGTAGNYAFLNGNCGDWSCKEDLSGQDCGDPNNYNDRILAPVIGDTVLSTCFGQCSTDGSCAAPPASYDVTFQVDMSQYEGSFGAVNLNGNFAGWCGSCIAMSDDDGDGIYAVTMELGAGPIEYKFTVDGWNDQENFEGGESCTLTTGEFTNRLHDVTGDVALDVVCWNSCDACPAISDVLGCTDASANNYNAEATAENGSCLYNTTFNVDMSCAGVDFYEVFVTGPIWGWPANSGFNQMLDEDGDGIFSVTIETPAGDVEYKYAVDGWADQENLIDDMQNGASCAPVTDYSGFANRLAASGSSTSDTYGSCDACADDVLGCTDEGACNYDASATADDGSCAFPASDSVDCDGNCLVAVDCAGECGGSAALDDCGVCGGDNSTCLDCAGVPNGMSEVDECGVCGGDGSSCADPGTPISECNLFAPGPNETWTHALTATTPDDPNSSAAQTLVLNVASLPEGGANYRVVKTVANGNWFNGNAQALSLGENSITVSGVSFARSVKFQFSSGDIGLSAIALNGTDLICGAGCTDEGACNYDASATADDGSCAFPASDSVDCDGNCLVAVDCAGECGGSAALDECGVCGGDGSSCAQANVTFQVDMNLFQGSFGGVFVNGSFNGWCGSCNPMSDDDGDGVWTVTLPLDPGTIEYKFTLDGWSQQENFAGGESCTITTDGYTNRVLTFDADTELPVVCYNSCDACPDEVFYYDVTFEVNTANIEVGPNGMYAGGGVLGDAQAVALSDDDGDGIWSATVNLLEGTSGNYIFLNSPNDGGNWDAKENLEGQECGDPNNWNDRILPPVTEDVTYSFCFGQCTAECPTVFYDLTFNVNAANIEVGPNGLYLGGGVFGGANAYAMSDDDGDGIWSVAVSVAEGTSGNYIFLNSPAADWDWGTKENLEGLPCSDPNNYNDRILPTVTGDTTYSTCFGQCSEDGSCEAPPVEYAVTFQVDMTNYGGEFGVVNLNGSFTGWCGSCVPMSDDDGDGVYEVTIGLTEGVVEYKFTVDGWNDQESFAEGESCTSTIDGYTNRTYEVLGDAALDVVCWNSCDACDVPGCTDEAACNYNSEATLDDGSCEAADDLTGCGDTCLDGGILYEFNISDVYSDGMCCAYGEGSYSIVVDGEVIASGGDFGASASEQFCAPAEACVQIVMVADNYPSEQSWSVTADGVEVLGAGLNGATATYYLGGCLPGCTDEAACNYDISANVDDDSCLELDACGECGGSGVDTDGDGVCDAEEIAGCQDEAACNYNPAATDPIPASGLNISLSAGSWPSEISWTLNGESYGAPFEGLIELAPGMYTLEGADSYGDGWNGAQMTIVDAASGASASFSVSGSSDSIEIEVTGAEGCTYAPEFYQCDGETCVNDADGDGVCDELEIDGCVVPTACNYDLNATNLVPCVYPEPGYTCDGECDGDADGDGICDDNEIAGCQDEAACNYNPDATDPAAINGLTISLSAGSWPSEISWTLNGESYGAPFDGFVELVPGVYTLEGADSYGDGWNGAEMTLVDASSGATSSFSVSGSSDSMEIEVTGAEGCDFESCLGCTDASACNFNSDATQEDGSCDYCSCVSGTVGGSNGFGLSVETYAEGGVLGTTTYRVYVTTPNEDDFVSAITGDENNPSFLRTSTSFYQNEFGGLTADQSNPFLFSVFPELAYDSWVTIGIDQAPVPGDGNGAISLVQADGDSWVEDFEAGGNMEINSFFGGSWFTTILDDNGVAGADQKVLLAQLTTDGTLSGQLYVQVFPEGNGDNAEYLTLSFGGNSSCGCTDEAACNYSDSALYDDGSCDYLSCTGCTDDAACNYEEGATVEDGSCVYPEAYLDCDGNCMNDANINGICDELEVLGCTYAAACNYNMEANVDDGQCDFSCIPSGCQGTDVVQGCTVPDAGNYDPAATCDNGSCVFSNECRADLDDDGLIGMGDLLEYLALFGSSCE